MHLLLRVLEREGAVAGGGFGHQERLGFGRHQQRQRLRLADLFTRKGHVLFRINGCTAKMGDR